MLANWITLSRFPLLAAWVGMLYLGSPEVRLAGVALLLLGLLLDTVDGVVARRTGQATLFGSVLDIAADRTYELVLWVCFAHAGLVHPAVPLVVVARTALTDAIRSIGVGQGTAPLVQQRSWLSRFLVGSCWMRTGYAGAKLFAFCGLALIQAFEGTAAGGPPRVVAVAPIVKALVWVTVALCVIRGLPVIMGGVRRNWRAPGGQPRGDTGSGWAEEVTTQ